MKQTLIRLPIHNHHLNFEIESSCSKNRIIELLSLTSSLTQEQNLLDPMIYASNEKPQPPPGLLAYYRHDDWYHNLDRKYVIKIQGWPEKWSSHAIYTLAWYEQEPGQNETRTYRQLQWQFTPEPLPIQPPWYNGQTVWLNLDFNQRNDFYWLTPPGRIEITDMVISQGIKQVTIQTPDNKKHFLYDEKLGIRAYPWLAPSYYQHLIWQVDYNLDFQAHCPYFLVGVLVKIINPSS